MTTLAGNVAVRKIKPWQPAKCVIQAALAGASVRFQTGSRSALIGDPVGVHRLRTATRRLRGELRTLRHLIESDWRESIEIELKWLATVLGGVRDLDVLGERLQTAASRLMWDGPEKYPEFTPVTALDPLFELIRERHDNASTALRNVLQSDRYARLVEVVGGSLDSVSENLSEAAESPCRVVLPPLVRSAWKPLGRGARALKSKDPAEAFHDVRKLSKRARYAAELIGPALGRDRANQARRFVRWTTRVQDVLGEHQDAIIAIEEICRIRAEHLHDEAFVHATDLLLNDQRDAADSARESFFKIWYKVDRKKFRRWMKSR